MKRLYAISVTYEFPLAPPETVTLEVSASSHGTAARLAFQAIKKAHQGRQPSSLVLVLDLDRRGDGQRTALRHAESSILDA